MPCDNPRVARLVRKLIDFQRQRDLYDRLLNVAPGLDLSKPDDGSLSRFLLTQPVRRSILVPSIEPFREPLVLEAVKEYPLDSPKMLGAAKAHGIPESILQYVFESINKNSGG